MSKEAIRPSTVDGIKRLAKSIKATQGIQHASALDEAARLAGFQNFKQARNELETKSPPPKHRIFLTAYWNNRKRGESGRETLVIELSVPWGDLITPLQFKHHRALSPFRADGPDHLTTNLRLQEQSHARRAVCALARTLHFMDATKLRPSRGYSRALPKGDWRNAIPGHDHYSLWYQPETKRYLFVDEPYEPAAQSHREAREAWARMHGFFVIKPTWAGMYAPDVGSRLYLVSDETKGVALPPIVAALDRLPPAMVEEMWNGVSAPMTPTFVSPGSMTKAVPISSKPKKIIKSGGQRNSVEYIRTFVGPSRRPKIRMPIAGHSEVGRLLQSVSLATFYRKGVYNRINAIRSELDDWAQAEYDHAELPNEQFFRLYYGESGGNPSRSLTDGERDAHLGSLRQVKVILSQHYPDCPPLRSLLAKIDSAIGSLDSWK